MWGTAVANSPITAAVKELVDVAVAAAANGIESVRAAADVGDGGLILCAPAEVIEAEATNWADEAGLGALIDSEKAGDAALGDSLVDDASSRQAGLRLFSIMTAVTGCLVAASSATSRPVSGE